MTLNKSNTLVSILLAVLLIFACKDDPVEPDPVNPDPVEDPMEDPIEPVETTVEEDQQNIQGTFNDGIACAQEMKSGKMVTSLLREFIDLSDGESLHEEWIDTIFTNLDQVIDVESVENNNRFDIGFFEGTYTFNIADYTWTKNNNLNDKIEINFPSSPLKNSNNAQISLENYTDKNVIINQESVWLPKQLDAKITADGEDIIRVNLNNIEYANNADFEIPIAIDLSVYMNPFEMNLIVDRINPTNFEIDMDFVSDNCAMGVKATIELEDDDFENLNENSFKSMTVEANINDLKIQSLTGLGELLKLSDDDYTENEINTLLDLEVLFNDLKIADLRFDEEAESLILVYKDSSEEDSAIYYEPFLNQLEALVQEFTGVW